MPCVFEKTLMNKRAKCHRARHFCLADREGYSCLDSESSANCGKFLEKLREKSVFVLKLKSIDAPLAHNNEIRVQVGELIGLTKLIGSSEKLPTTRVEAASVIDVLGQVIGKYGSLAQLPNGEIIQAIGQYQGRRRRQRRK